MIRTNKQKGQSLFLVIILLGVVSLSVVSVFNAGVLSNQKVELQNAADAAAYSSATFVARDLNFKSYTNRAMVANQVAIAQFVGLSSWMEMMYNASRNLATVTAWIPYVGQFTNAIRQVMNAVNNVAQPVLEGATTFSNWIISALSMGQQVFHFQMNYAAIDSANKVVEANDADINFGAVSNGLLTADTARIWYNFSDRIDTSSRNRKDRRRKQEFRDVINDSKDPFSNRRTYRWFGTPRIIGLPAFRVEKAGGSDLLTTGRTETWTGMDTVAVWVGNWGCRRFRCRWRWRETLPTGWASASSGQNYNMFNGRRIRNVWGNTWRVNRRTSSLAARNVNRLRSYDGLRDYYDINRDGRYIDTTDVKVVIGKSDEDIRTSSQTQSENANGELAHWSDGSLDIEEHEGQVAGFSGDEMSAVAKAEAYFQRPNSVDAMRRTDRRIEFANYYSPYWNVRLVDTTRGERLTAIGIINAF